MKKIIATSLLLLLCFPLLAGNRVDLSEIWDEIVWCGPHMDKALVCHSGNGKKYQEICVSINSLKQGHLTAASGTTRLHGDDYFGSCKPSPSENRVSIYPCNAGIKRRLKNAQSNTTGDTTSVYGDFNDYIHAEVATISSSPSDNSYGDNNYNQVSIPSGRDQYNILSENPFSTMLNNDHLNFLLHSETYGTNYYVDWCITQTNPENKLLDVVVSTSANRYIENSNLVTKFELHCGEDEDDLRLIADSSYEQMHTIINVKKVGIPSVPKCIWRQRFIETKETVRPNSSEMVIITGELNIN